MPRPASGPARQAQAAYGGDRCAITSTLRRQPRRPRSASRYAGADNADGGDISRTNTLRIMRACYAARRHVDTIVPRELLRPAGGYAVPHVKKTVAGRAGLG